MTNLEIYLTKIIISFILTISLIASACGPTTSSTISSTSKIPPKTSFIDDDKTAIFVIAAPDSPINDRRFDLWNQTDKTKGKVHGFADPSAKKEFEGLTSVKHFISAEHLAEEMTRVLEGIKVKRLLLFVSAHGAPSGNWCYENRRSCGLTEDVLIKLLKAPSNLDEVLIIPRSCFNKKIMDRFAIKAKAYSWPFNISFLVQKNEDSCTNLSIANALMINYIEYRLKYDLIENIFATNNLSEVIALYSGEWKFSKDQFEIQKLNEDAPEIKLNDFGFNLGARTNLFFDTKNPLPFPLNKTAEEFLKNFSLAKKFYKNIEELWFYFDTDKEGLLDHLVININGDVSKTFNNPELKNKKILVFDAILRRQIP